MRPAHVGVLGVAAADADGDGNITKQEAVQYIRSRGLVLDGMMIDAMWEVAPPPPPVREAGARHTTCRSVRAAGASAAPVPPLKAGGRRTRAASVDLNYLRVGRERPLPCTVKVLLVLHTAFSAGPTRRRTQGTEEASSSARRGATRRRPLRCAGERSRHSCDSSPPLTYRIHAPTTCSSP